MPSPVNLLQISTLIVSIRPMWSKLINNPFKNKQLFVIILILIA